MQQGKEVKSFGSERVAPRDTGLEAGTHESGATGGAAANMVGDDHKALACPACGLGVGVLAQACCCSEHISSPNLEQLRRSCTRHIIGIRVQLQTAACCCANHM